MKIEISKPSQHAPVMIRVTESPAKKPLVLELRKDQLAGLIDIARAAINADQFSFSWEQ
jgi:hypothetical protein